MESTVPDTLVLKIIERDELNVIDNVVYILYDQRYQRYVIRGKRRDTVNIKSQDYSFECDNSRHLAEFIEFMMDKNYTFSYILYNYTNLPEKSDDITFDFLFDNDDLANEMTGYDDEPMVKHKLLKMFRILKNVYNFY